MNEIVELKLAVGHLRVEVTADENILLVYERADGGAHTISLREQTGLDGAWRSNIALTPIKRIVPKHLFSQYSYRQRQLDGRIFGIVGFNHQRGLVAAHFVLGTQSNLHHTVALALALV